MYAPAVVNGARTALSGLQCERSRRARHAGRGLERDLVHDGVVVLELQRVGGRRGHGLRRIAALGDRNRHYRRARRRCRDDDHRRHRECTDAAHRISPSCVGPGGRCSLIVSSNGPSRVPNAQRDETVPQAMTPWGSRKTRVPSAESASLLGFFVLLPGLVLGLVLRLAGRRRLRLRPGRDGERDRAVRTAEVPAAGAVPSTMPAGRRRVGRARLHNEAPALELRDRGRLGEAGNRRDDHLARAGARDERDERAAIGRRRRRGARQRRCPPAGRNGASRRPARRSRARAAPTWPWRPASDDLRHAHKRRRAVSVSYGQDEERAGERDGHSERSKRVTPRQPATAGARGDSRRTRHDLGSTRRRDQSRSRRGKVPRSGATRVGAGSAEGASASAAFISAAEP